MCLKIINVNPSKRKTEDSFVRSLTIALNISYKDAFRTISDFALGANLSMVDTRTIKGVLKFLGYTEQVLKESCSVGSFADRYAKTDKVYLLRIGRNNTTVIKNKIIYDNFDASRKIINSYWIIDRSVQETNTNRRSKG